MAPDWRDSLRASVRRFALRCWGALLVGVAIAAAVALLTHNSTDPSFTTAAGGPPANWLGSVGAYASDMLLLLFGLGSALLLPVVAIAGIRMIRLERPGRTARALLIAAIGAVLVGVALGLMSGSAVSGLPGGWGGVLGLAAANGVDSAVGLIANPAIAGPVRFAILLLFAIAGLLLGYLALSLQPDEKGWLSGLFSRRPRSERPVAPRATQIREYKSSAAPPKARPAVAVG
jgi:S-DNA-T family DNA segregation ATPase FtsK/SpoIIIE